MFAKLKELICDERGQSTTEYILILAVVVMIAMKFKASMTSHMGALTDNIFEQVNNATNPPQ